jgi:hypothetical protein
VTVATIDPGHTVVLTPRVEGECSFLPGDFMATGSEWPSAQCRQPAEYTMTDTNGLDADLCRHHAAHVRACRKCSPFVLEVREWLARWPQGG